MNRKHFILASALSGLAAAILPKRGESAPIPPATEVKTYTPVYTATPEPAVVTVPSNVNELPKLCIFDTPDGFTVLPKYRGSAGIADPLNHRCTIGVKWQVGGVKYGTWFETEDEDMFFDAEALLYAVRNDRTLGQRLVAGETPAQVPDNEVARLRAEYRAHTAKTP